MRVFISFYQILSIIDVCLYYLLIVIYDRVVHVDPAHKSEISTERRL